MDLSNVGNILEITIIIRVLSSVLLGFAIGLEREMTNKYAGLRTNILVCLGACVFTIISIYGFPEVSVTGDELGTRDTARVAAQVVTGIGFIGGGTVLRHGATVFGLTTAATLWISASIGMACGVGMYGLAITATICSILVLVSVRIFETNVLPTSTKIMKRLKLNLCVKSLNADNAYSYVIEHYPELIEISRKFDKQNSELTKIAVVLDVRGKNPIPDMYKNFQKLDGVESISIEECKE